MRSKTDHFTPSTVRLAAVAKALGHPARLAILQTLAERGTCVCGEIVSVMPLAQSTVSQHLKALKAAGLVRGEIDGPRSCYCLDEDAVRALSRDLTAFLEPITDAITPGSAAADSSAGDCC